MRDLSYILRERQRRADPECQECHGDGTVTYTAHNRDGEEEAPCECVMRPADYSDAPDPLADEGQSDARELGRER
tara:strand:+ start:1261 stop:1485 length:225 start_codon:yes stop_codon:yes gene_type:complete